MRRQTVSGMRLDPMASSLVNVTSYSCPIEGVSESLRFAVTRALVSIPCSSCLLLCGDPHSPKCNDKAAEWSSGLTCAVRLLQFQSRVVSRIT